MDRQIEVTLRVTEDRGNGIRSTVLERFLVFNYSKPYLQTEADGSIFSCQPMPAEQGALFVIGWMYSGWDVIQSGG